MTKKNDKEKPAWVEVTPETVTSPADLLRVANHVFDELRRDMPIVKYPELKAIKDTPDTLGEALSWESLRPEQEGVLYQRLEPLEGLPSREIIDARIINLESNLYRFVVSYCSLLLNSTAYGIL